MDLSESATIPKKRLNHKTITPHDDDDNTSDKLIIVDSNNRQSKVSDEEDDEDHTKPDDIEEEEEEDEADFVLDLSSSVRRRSHDEVVRKEKPNEEVVHLEKIGSLIDYSFLAATSFLHCIGHGIWGWCHFKDH